MRDLPIEYIPLSRFNLEVGMQFGPVQFVVSPYSHAKSKRLLEESDLNGQTNIATPYLFPSELWGWARIFSSYFGRLNEVAVSRAKWEIYGTANPVEELSAQSRVLRTNLRNGLSFATAETTTFDTNRNTLIKCVDELLLLHDVDFLFYQEKGKEIEIPSDLSYDRIRKVYFRHNWDDGKWLNNIHTDSYARQFGYERGLPEFIMYMDWIFLSQLEQHGERVYEDTTIDIKKILPIYRDETIRVVETEGAQHKKVRFFRGNQERLEAIVQAGTK